MRVLENGMEVYGECSDIQMTSIYFKEFDFQSVKTLGEGIIIEKILSINTSINIGETDIIKTPIMISNNGEFFSGYKLKVELIIDIKAKYIEQRTPRSLGLMREKLVKFAYIVLPLDYNGVNMIDLLRRKKIIVNTYIEDIYCDVRKNNSIYTNISAITIAEFEN